MDGDAFAQAARWLGERSALALPFRPDCRDLHAVDPGPVIAVDGSQAVLADSGGVWVVAVRARAVTWPGPPPLPLPPQVHATIPVEAGMELDAAYARWGLDAPAARSAEAFAEAWREIAELEAAVAAVGRADPGTTLLLDGAFEHLDARAQPAADRILDAADRRGVPVVGVAKRSRLQRGGVALVPAVLAAGPTDRAWAAPVPDYDYAHIARLHAKARHAFRVDATQPDLLGALLPLSRDAVYLGYPYPLALAHNEVAITNAETRTLRAGLHDRVLADGGPDAMRLLADFHEVLDANTP